MRNNRTVQTADNNLVAFVQDTVGKHNVQCCTETFDDLDFEDRAFEFGDVHELSSHPLLRQFDDQHEHIWNTFPSESGCRNERDVPCEVCVLVVRYGIERLLGESQDCLAETLSELILHGFALLGQRGAEVAVRC